MRIFRVAVQLVFLVIGISESRSQQLPTIHVNRPGDYLIISWNPPVGTLQSARIRAGASAQWNDLGTTNPVTAKIQSEGFMYRVRLESNLSTNSESWSAKAFGAFGDGIHDDTEALQSGLNAVTQVGGGRFLIPAGTYIVTNSLLIGSNTQVLGEGRGVSILKERSVVGRLGRFVDGAQVYATLAMVGITNGSVHSLTVDHRESTNWMNGIVLMPTGASLTGTTAVGCSIEDCEILGHPGHHTYLIWSMRAEQAHIENNFCDGGMAVPAETGQEQEGIEVFGGKNIWITGNVIRRISNRGINVGSSPGVAKTSVDGVWVADNDVSFCKIGGYVNTSFDAEIGHQDTSHVTFKSNRFQNLWLAGIEAYVSEYTTMKGVLISGNSISNVVGPGTVGIELFGYGKSQGAPIHLQDITVDHNIISCVTNTTTLSAPIHVTFWENSLIEDNVVVGGTGRGIEISYTSNEITIRRNSIENSWFSGLLIENSSNCFVTGNSILSYDQSEIGSAGILITGARNVVVSGNQLTANPGIDARALFTSPECSDVTAFDNHLLSPTMLSDPFYIGSAEGIDSGSP